MNSCRHGQIRVDGQCRDKASLSKADILDEWDDKRNKGNSPLWTGTADEIYSIIKNNSKDKALSMLRYRRDKYKNMALSGYYQRAINQLR